jgi:uncharacterized protein
MAAEIYLRFYEELNDHLAPDQRKREFAYPLNRGTSIRQLLQDLNVPSSEVELVLINGSSVGLSHFLKAGDRVSIYPVFESLDVKSVLKIRREPLRRTKFTAVGSLYGLASCLRSLGFDVLIESTVCVEHAEAGNSILLTTDPAMLYSGFSRIYVIQKTDPSEQLKEVLARFDLDFDEQCVETDADSDSDSDTD